MRFFLSSLFCLLAFAACAQGPSSGTAPDTVRVPDVAGYPTCDSVQVTVFDHPHAPGKPVAVSMDFACAEIRKITPSTADTWCGLLRECRGATFPVRLEAEGYSPRIVQMIFLPF